jgi:hypothetical protein
MRLEDTGFSGKILTAPCYEGPVRHPLDSPNILTNEENKKRYTVKKEKYDKELATALKQDIEARGLTDQLNQEITALGLERRSTQVLMDTIGRSKMLSQVFGAEQLLNFNDRQQQGVLLGVLTDRKRAVIHGTTTFSTDMRLIC